MSIVAANHKVSFSYRTKQTLFTEEGRNLSKEVPSIKCIITNTENNTTVAETEVSRYHKDRENRIQGRTIAFLKTLVKVEGREVRKALANTFNNTVKTDYSAIKTIKK